MITRRLSSPSMPRAGGSDPLGPARAAARISDSGKRIANEVQKRDDAEFGTRDRDARLFAQVEASRVRRELGADVEDVRNGVPESGAGFSDGAISRFDERVQQSRDRAGDDPLRLRYLDEQFKREREENLRVFEKAERTALTDYSYNEHLLSLDDHKQRVGRTSFVVAPSNSRERLKHTESGGNPRIVNSEGYMGLYQFGNARLADYKRATGQTFTNEEFLADENLQERVQAWSEGDHDRYILDNGLDRFLGSEINGVVMNVEAMRAVAHLGGQDGLKKFLTTNGKYNPQDSNKTSLTDYARTHGATDRMGVPVGSGQKPDLKSNPAFVDALGDMHDQIDAMEVPKATKAKLKREAEAELTSAALLSVGRDDPGAALSLLRSGELDSVLSNKQSLTLEGSMESAISRLEKEISSQAASADKVFKAEAVQRFEDWKSWGAAGGEGERPEFDQADMDALTLKQQIEARNLPGVWATEDGARTVPLDQADGFLEQIKPSGDNYEAEKMAFDSAAEIIDERKRISRAENHIAASLDNRTVPNMDDPDVKELMEERFQNALHGTDNPLQTAFHFLESYKTAPEGMNDMIAGVMGGDNPELKQQMAARLSTTDPRALASLDVGPVEAALALNEWLSLGLTMDDATKLSNDLIHPANSSLHDARSELWKDTDAGLPDEALELFSEIVGEESNAVLPETVWAEYESIARDKFLATGRVEVSAKLAATAFLRRHDVTNIGPKRWQIDPPERLYPVYGDAKRDSAWIEAQALELAQKDFPKAQAVSLESVRSEGRSTKPRYRVTVDDGEGGIQILPDLYRPDPTSERAALQGLIEIDTARDQKSVDRAKVISELRDAQAARSGFLERLEAASDAFDLEGGSEQEMLDALKAYQDHMGKISELNDQRKKLFKPEKRTPFTLPDPDKQEKDKKPRAFIKREPEASK